VLLIVSPASADIIYSIYSTDANIGGDPVSGTASFHLDGHTLAVTLENTTPDISKIIQLLDGIRFTLSGGSGVTLTLLSVSAQGFYDCADGTTCISETAFDDDHTGISQISPYEWGFTGSLLSAGNGSFKPAGIVNSSVTALTGLGNGGLGNPQHNDFLLGPVLFTVNLGYITPPTGVSSATFYWGTSGDHTADDTGVADVQATTVPEPASIALLGGILLLAGRAIKRRFA